MSEKFKCKKKREIIKKKLSHLLQHPLIQVAKQTTKQTPDDSEVEHVAARHVF